jgi:hypothetical protein
VAVAYLKVIWNFLSEGDGSHSDKVKGKESHYRPGQALRVPGV